METFGGFCCCLAAGGAAFLDDVLAPLVGHYWQANLRGGAATTTCQSGTSTPPSSEPGPSGEERQWTCLTGVGQTHRAGDARELGRWPSWGNRHARQTYFCITACLVGRLALSTVARPTAGACARLVHRSERGWNGKSLPLDIVLVLVRRGNLHAGHTCTLFRLSAGGGVGRGKEILSRKCLQPMAEERSQHVVLPAMLVGQKECGLYEQY